MNQRAPGIVAICRVCHEPLGSRPYRTVNVRSLAHHGPVTKHPCPRSRRHVPPGGLRVHDGCEVRYVGCCHLIVSPPYALAELEGAFERVEMATFPLTARVAQALCL